MSLAILPSSFITSHITALGLSFDSFDISTDASVWPAAVLRGDLLPIRIGARTSIQDGSIVHTSHDGPFTPGGSATTVGQDVTIGHSVPLHGCTIHDRVLLGIGSIILDGVVIESDVMIGAGSLVTPGKTLPPLN